MKYLSLFFTSIVFSNLAFAEPKTTAELLRGQLFVDPEKTEESIVETWKGGAWKEKGLSGSYRFITTKAGNGANKLYVQWINAEGETAYSMSIRELNERPEYQFVLPDCAGNVNCNTVVLNVQHTYEKHKQKFVLEFPKLGKYKLAVGL